HPDIFRFSTVYSKAIDKFLNVIFAADHGYKRVLLYAKPFWTHEVHERRKKFYSDHDNGHRDRRLDVKFRSHGNSDTGSSPDHGSCSQTRDIVIITLQDHTCTEEADAADDLGCQPERVHRDIDIVTGRCGIGSLD